METSVEYVTLTNDIESEVVNVMKTHGVSSVKVSELTKKGNGSVINANIVISIRNDVTITVSDLKKKLVEAVKTITKFQVPVSYDPSLTSKHCESL